MLIKLKEKPSSSLLGPKFQDHSDKMEERRVAQPLLLFSQQKEHSVPNTIKQRRPLGEKKRSLGL